MKWTTRALIFVLSFVLEVRVKAADPAAESRAREILQQPEGCLKKTSICALKTRHQERFELELQNESRIVLDENSALVRISQQTVKHVSGLIWVRSQTAVHVQLPYGQVRIKGEVWLEKKERHHDVIVQAGEAELVPRGGRESIVLLAGQRNWLGQVSESGRASSGFPRPIDFQRHIVRVTRLYEGSKKELMEELRRVRGAWLIAAETSAQVQKDVALREIARARLRRKKALERSRRRRAAEAEMRKLFRRKNYLEP